MPAYRFVVNDKRDKVVVKETNNIVKVDVNLQKVIVKDASVNIRIHEYSRGPEGKVGEKGEKGDQGIGIPGGGLEGYALRKASDADYDFMWSPPILADKNYSKNFTVSSSVTVDHELNKYPTVTVIDSAGDEVEGNVNYLDMNHLVVTFAAPFSGRITCN